MAGWWRQVLGRPATPARPAVRAQQTELARKLAGGRLSVDRAAGLIAGNALVLLAPAAADQDWRRLDLDAATLDTVSPAELMGLLTDLSPDISRALWDFLRLCNPGWEALALRAGDEEDAAGQAALDAFIARLVNLYGSFDVVIGRLFMGAFIRGGFFAELVLDKRGRKPLDLVTPDPDTVRFRQVIDAERGPVWQLCQYNGLQVVDLDRPTVLYIPVDPLPGAPYGRPPAAPALFASLFLLGLLHDLRRVVAQQDYPRLDLSVSLEKLHTAMPADLEDDPDAVKNWIAAVVSEVQTVYAGLQPDDAYIHTDVVSVNRPVGAVDASSLGAVDGLIRALERMITRALKTMPLLMADTANTSEANANRQWEVHAAGIKSLQHLAESLLQRLLGLALQAQGIRTTVQFRFAELRAAELLRDAQTEALQIANSQAKYAQGWISQDEAALGVVGHAADLPAPRVRPPGWAGAAAGRLENVQAEPGGNRAGSGTRSREEREEAKRPSELGGESDARVKIIPDGAAEPLPALPDAVEITDGDMRRAIDAWDAALPEYAGLLEAAVVGREEWDAQGRVGVEPSIATAGIRSYGDDSPWVWDQASRRYRDTRTGRFVAALRELIVTTFLDQYALAHGGRHNLTQRDLDRTAALCRDQYRYLDGFAQDINAGRLSPAQIAARSRLYIAAATQAYERAGAAVRGIPALPAYPGDASTACGANCRCAWEFVETETAWECTWTLHPAEHCADCLARAAAWAPYVVAK